MAQRKEHPEDQPVPSTVGVFDLDLRSLALFRVALGLVLITDLWIRSYDFTAHYTQDGWLPLEALSHITSRPWQNSLFQMHPSGEWAAFLFLIQGLSSLFFLVGFRTRLANIVCWFLTLHIQARNPMVLDLSLIHI